MRSICLCFHVHQPFRLKRYRFFDIGNDHYYYDDYLNESILRKVADNCYLPANDVILKIIKEYGNNFKVAFSISGIVLDQFELYAPEVIDSFKKLSETGCVEFLSDTYSHSLSSLFNENEFKNEIKEHDERIEYYFNQKPVVFRNTELIYSDQIGEIISEMGFKGIITEGAQHILGWKSPNFLYYNPKNPRLKIMLRNFKLSDDIAFRFSNKAWSEYPLTAEKFAHWLNQLNKKEEVINIYVDYETFGEHQWMDSGIFDFLKNFPSAVFKYTDFSFNSPSEVMDLYQPIASLNVQHPISWADVEKDLTAWLGNELQNDACSKLYQLAEKVKNCNDKKIRKDWKYLQSSDHFYFMCTKFFSDGEIHAYFNPYESPYDAYINYMNVLNDFSIRVEEYWNNFPKDNKEEIEELKLKVLEYESIIKKLKEENSELLKKIEKTKSKSNKSKNKVKK